MRLLVGMVVIVAAQVHAQQGHSMQTLRRAGLSQSEGPVPTLYSPAVKDRALRSQAALQQANAWFEQQLGRVASMTLAVLDAETLAKVSAMPIASSWFEPNLILFPADIQNLMPQLYAGRDRDNAADAALFHESGHIFANEISIQGGGFINELVPNVFAAAYIRVAKPELAFVLEGAPTGLKPRYTSWEDLLYLRETVGVENYLWFQMELQKLADWCVRTHGFAHAVDAFHPGFSRRTLLPGAHRWNDRKGGGRAAWFCQSRGSRSSALRNAPALYRTLWDFGEGRAAIDRGRPE